MKLPRYSGKPKSLKRLNTASPRQVFLVRRVVGDSMRPRLRPDVMIVAHSFVKRLKVGDVVIVSHHGLEKIKRIADLQDQNLFVLGDNLARSTDSRQFGWLPRTAVVGKVIWPRL